MEDKDIEIIEQYITSNFRITLPENVLLSLENLLQEYKIQNKMINEMALYIKNIKTDYIKEYCNLENCDYSIKKCSSKCIIDYFRKKCE